VSHQGSKSWGPAAGTLPAEDRYYRWQGVLNEFACVAGRDCPDAASHWTAYCYTTGRTGSTVQATRKVCERHAWQFATKHNITVTTEPPRPTTTQTVIGEFLTDSQAGEPQPWAP
jgi:hypothetical protein